MCCSIENPAAHALFEPALIHDPELILLFGRIVRRQAEEAAEILHVAEGDVGAADDGDGLPAAVDAGGVERVDVVDFREVGRRDVVARAAGVVRNRLEAVVHRLPPEVVQRDDAADDVGEPTRDRRVLGVGGVELAVDVEFVDLGLEGALDLADAAADVDPAAPIGDLVDEGWDISFWGNSYADSVNYWKLQVDKDLPVHGNIHTYQEVIALIRKQVANAQALAMTRTHALTDQPIS